MTDKQLIQLFIGYNKLFCIMRSCAILDIGSNQPTHTVSADGGNSNSLTYGSYKSESCRSTSDRCGDFTNRINRYDAVQVVYRIYKLRVSVFFDLHPVVGIANSPHNQYPEVDDFSRGRLEEL